MDNQNNQPIEPETNLENTQPEMSVKNKNTLEIIISLIIILAVIIFVGVYFWSNLNNKETTKENLLESDNLTPEVEQELKQIEEEINTTDLNKIDDDLEQIQKEIDAELNKI